MLLDYSVAAIVAFLVSLLTCRAMIAAGPIDSPTEARKQEIQNRPTPTSGGIGMSVGFAAAMIVLGSFSLVWRHQLNDEGAQAIWTTVLFAFPLVAIGFIDDARHLSAAFKFVVYAVLSLAGAWLLGVVGEIRFGALIVHLPLAVGILGTALWVFTLINVVNFMDGANGLSMGCVAVGLAALSVIALQGGVHSVAALALCGVGALLGFLVWNCPAGKLFAGDSGALFAGALAAFAALIAIARTGMSPLVAPILFFPLLADALLTLHDRVRRGRSLMVGHTEHLYQLAIRSGWSHARTAVVYWLAMLVCGAIGVAVAPDPTHIAPALALAALALISLIVNSAIRRTCLERGILSP